MYQASKEILLFQIVARAVIAVSLECDKVVEWSEMSVVPTIVMMTAKKLECFPSELIVFELTNSVAFWVRVFKSNRENWDLITNSGLQEASSSSSKIFVVSSEMFLSEAIDFKDFPNK